MEKAGEPAGGPPPGVSDRARQRRSRHWRAEDRPARWVSASRIPPGVGNKWRVVPTLLKQAQRPKMESLPLSPRSPYPDVISFSSPRKRILNEAVRSWRSALLGHRPGGPYCPLKQSHCPLKRSDESAFLPVSLPASAPSCPEESPGLHSSSELLSICCHIQVDFCSKKRLIFFSVPEFIFSQAPS